ncbi:MAG: hypothetical protein WC833_03570 [Bacteroidales bacterium]
MKKLKLLLFVFICSLGSAYAQFPGSRAVPIEETAKRNIVNSLKTVEGLTEAQIDKLVEIDLKIDKELPFLTILFADNKKWRDRMDKVGIMKETLYKDVLTPKQMEEISRLVKKGREIRESKSKK